MLIITLSKMSTSNKYSYTVSKCPCYKCTNVHLYVSTPVVEQGCSAKCYIDSWNHTIKVYCVIPYYN